MEEYRVEGAFLSEIVRRRKEGNVTTKGMEQGVSSTVREEKKLFHQHRENFAWFEERNQGESLEEEAHLH